MVGGTGVPVGVALGEGVGEMAAEAVGNVVAGGWVVAQAAASRSRAAIRRMRRFMDMILPVLLALTGGNVYAMSGISFMNFEIYSTSSRNIRIIFPQISPGSPGQRSRS